MANTKISEATLTIPTLTDKFPLARVGDTTARYATMEGISGSALNVKSYGAVGDGATDDTVAIQAAFDALHSTYGTYGTYHALYFPTGNYLISDTISAKTLYRCYVTGDSARITTKSGSDFTGKCLINFSGSGYTTILGMAFVSDLTANKPTACVIYGRNSDGNGGDIHFEHCIFSGDCTVASLLFAQGDTSSFTECRIQSTGTAPALLMTTYNDSGLLDYTSSTSTLCRFTNCYIFSYEATNPKIIVMQGLIQRTIFDTCFIYLPGVTAAVSIEDSAGAGTSNQVYNLTFINTSVEGGTSGALWLSVTNSYGLNALTVINGAWSANSTYIINVNSADADYGLFYADINEISKSYSATKMLHLTAGKMKYCRIKCTSQDIYTEAGTTAESNFIDCRGGYQPFGSSAGTEQYNISFDHNGLIAGTILAGDVYAVADGNATPYAVGLVMVFANTNPTTVTTLLNVPAVNRIATCLTTNGNTTFTGHPDYGHILLSGRDSWTMPAGATLTLVYYNGDWYEVGRMNPT